jgi:hypothetical protein
MADALSTITTLIQSPPVHVAAGGVWQAIAVQFGLGLGLFYGVTKFFDLVGDRLNDDMKLEIAVWLLGVKVGQTVEPWPDTFSRLFDRVFGERHLSWKCIWRSTVASLTVSTVVFLFTMFSSRGPFLATPITWSTLQAHPSFLWTFVVIIIQVNVLPDYLFLLKTRWLLSCMKRHISTAWWVTLIVTDFFLTLYLANDAVLIGLSSDPSVARKTMGYSVVRILVWWKLLSAEGEWVFFYPAFFTSIWLWLYAGSGFILKAARRFDVGFDWFNRKFDIEKKPLQSIGLVAGASVATAYWVAVIVSRVVG